jgi:F0F1-type ATP synthase membrane subunit b/b'
LKKDAESGLAQVQSKANQLGRDAKAEASKVDAKLEQYRQDAAAQLNKTGKEANKAIDKFDKEVTEVSDQFFCRAGGQGHRWAGGDEGG